MSYLYLYRNDKRKKLYHKKNNPSGTLYKLNLKGHDECIWIKVRKSMFRRNDCKGKVRSTSKTDKMASLQKFYSNLGTLCGPNDLISNKQITYDITVTS